MTMSLELIEKVVKSKKIQVSEEEFNEAFNTITSHIERAEYEEAAPLIKSSLKEQVCDIRIAMYCIFLCVHTGGIQSLCDAIPLIELLLTKHWDVLSPLPKRDQHAQTSLRWFLSRLIKIYEKVDRSFKNKNTTPLQEITVGVTDKSVQSLKSNILSLNEVLSEKWKNPALGNHLLNVQKWAVDLSTLNPTTPLDEKEETQQPPVAEKKEVTSKKEPNSKAKVPDENPEISKPTDSEVVPAPPESFIEPSSALHQLIQKLQAFQLLIEQEDFKKAAIISDDIEKKIESFNPVEYFPKVFTEYYALYAKNAEKIEEELSETHSSLLKLYQADLDKFLEW